MRNKTQRYAAGLLALLMALLMLSGLAATETAAKEEAPLRFYLVRHGQTYSNIKEATIGGGGNAQLTATGRKLAFSLGMGMEDEDIQFIAAYSSTLGRAHETAHWILSGAGQVDLPITERDGLKDISWGAVEGGRIADLEKKYGVDGNDFEYYFGNYFDEDYVGPVEGTESTRQFADRFEAALLEIAKEHEGESGNILVTAHSTIGFYLSKFSDGKPAGTPNTSACIVEYADGEFSLVEYGNVAYLNDGREKYDAMRPLEIVLVTTPQTIFQQAGVLEGSSDSNLTEAGQKAAESLGNKMAGGAPLAVYASELNRSKKSSEIAFGGKNIALSLDSRLDEMFLGYWEAEKISVLEKTDYANYRLLTSANYISSMPAVEGAGEKADRAAARLEGALRDMGEKHLSSEGKIVVFTHPFILKAFLNEQFPTYQVPASKNMQVVTLTFKDDVFEMKESLKDIYDIEVK